MKRNIALLACVFALTACGSDSGSDNGQNGGSKNNENAANSTSESNASKSNQNGGDQFDNKNAKQSYALGMDIGNSLKKLPIDFELDQLNQGIQDVVKGNQTKLTQKQVASVMQNVVSDMKTAQKERSQKKAQSNAAKGKKFLAKNKKKKGVKTLDDGLQYKVIKKGSGPRPDANDSVTVDYVGKLIDGTVFDSSKKRGKPVTFPVNAVIPGWTEALQMMKQGAKYKLFIPPDLAYGKRGSRPKIGPNETLIFNVHLIKVDKKKGSGNGGNGAEDKSQQGGQGASGTSGNSNSENNATSGAGQEDNS